MAGTLLDTVRTYAWEFARCTRHNLLHLQLFRIGYRRGLWRVSDGEVHVDIPHYPYLAFHDIEGYLRDGRWKIEPGMTVIDAGGCFGEFAAYAARRVGPSGRVLMFEPDPANIEVARRTFAANGSPSNIEIVPAGLWSKPGKLRFSAGHDAQSTVITGDAPVDGPTIEIDVESLPSAVERYKLERLDFVKMDVEGAELEALSTIGELPPALKPRYAIASYHVVDGKPTAEALPGIFERIGYRCETGNPRHLTTWAFPATNGDGDGHAPSRAGAGANPATTAGAGAVAR